MCLLDSRLNSTVCLLSNRSSLNLKPVWYRAMQDNFNLAKHRQVDQITQTPFFHLGSEGTITTASLESYRYVSFASFEKTIKSYFNFNYILQDL